MEKRRSISPPFSSEGVPLSDAPVRPLSRRETLGLLSAVGVAVLRLDLVRASDGSYDAAFSIGLELG